MTIFCLKNSASTASTFPVIFKNQTLCLAIAGLTPFLEKALSKCQVWRLFWLVNKRFLFIVEMNLTLGVAITNLQLLIDISESFSNLSWNSFPSEGNLSDFHKLLWFGR
jgi:hypothetical protein